MNDWFARHGDIQTFHTALADLNGQPRGKAFPIARADAIQRNGLRTPLAALTRDITGAEGDTPKGHGITRATDRGPVPMPWLDAPAALLPLWMFHDTGRPCASDPRHALAAVLARYTQYDLAPLIATGLEFYLLDHRNPAAKDSPEILSMRTLDTYDAYFTDLYRMSADMGIGADAAISDAGPGQFEVAFEHTDAMRAADDTWLFKRLVKGLAQRHGLTALFSAKAEDGAPGNSLTVNFSIMTEEEENLFSDLLPNGRDTLGAAVAGTLAAMPASMAIFAPHAASYARFQRASHAPTGIAWGYDNRTTALRIPTGPAFARRIEHRVAGADANPYLLLATILGAALNGIESKSHPPAPFAGNGYEADLDRLPDDPVTALNIFASAPEMRRILPGDLIRAYTLTKRADLRITRALPEDRRADLFASLI